MVINEAPGVRRDAGSGRWRWLWFAGPAAFAATLTLIASAPPGGHFLGVVAAIGAWLLAGVWWLGLLIVPATRRNRWNAWPPVIAVVTAALVVTGLPTRAAFLVSEAALLDYAESLPAEDGYLPVDRFVGVFPISDVQRSDGVLIFAVDGVGGMLEQCGFAYAPGGDGQALPVTTADHLTGDWYATCTDFD
ncbi:hypothetical protein [Planotetraspora kaengkrachanensis]|uniref:Uncharacterized protein n=1 Tax=Planotetraspora kaengkrachanensis TaxID=575193 RepID=A0A8J3PV31_9ACTN|nr:hypothetical protein [Planotetraspora kaengkrachanensis]GIG81562.1 hypothetical protein Pka01_46890 [Planotetraspora kaengkrachanensis]